MQRQINAEELNDFYSAIGKAVWQLQYLEHGLVTFVVMKRHKRKPTSIEQANERLENERKGTLGTLYGRAKDEKIIPEELRQRFDILIDERNWLIHQSRTNNSDDLYNDDLRTKVISRIKNIQKEAINLSRKIFEELEMFMVSEDVDLDRAYRLAEKKLNKLKGI